MKAAISPIKASTQEFLEIEDIKDGIVILRDGSCVLVISTTATNFGLLSEKEQDAAIYAYGALLNSLNFAIQILIRSKRKDISSYLRLLEDRENQASKKQLKNQIRKYREFIQSTVQVNNVLEKDFYVIIPMSFLEIGLGKTISTKVKKPSGLAYPKEYILEKAKTNLYPKRDHLFRLLNRLGLKPRQLSTQELVRLFFEIYNPESQGQVLSESGEYQTPIVKPAASFKETPVQPKAVLAPPPPTAPAPTSQPKPEPPSPAPAASPQAPVPAPAPAPALEPKPEPKPDQEIPSPPLTETEAEPVSQTITEPEKGGLQSKIHELVDQAISPAPSPTNSTPVFQSESSNNQS